MCSCHGYCNISDAPLIQHSLLIIDFIGQQKYILHETQMCLKGIKINTNKKGPHIYSKVCSYIAYDASYNAIRVLEEYVKVDI